jgi:hypothetical protein
MDVSGAIFQHLRLPVENQCKGPSGTADVKGLVTLIQYQAKMINHQLTIILYVFPYFNRFQFEISSLVISIPLSSQKEGVDSRSSRE